MSEDRFFQQVNAAMTDYSPEVPATVYAGMRKKLWWSNFTRLNATRFNVWYAALILTGGLVWFAAGKNQAGSAPADATIVNETATDESPVMEASSGAENQTAVSEITQESSTQAKTVVNPKSTANADAVALKDETTTQSIQPELVSEAVTSEGQSVSEATANQPESASAKPGSKKGLKVKTFNTSDKK